MKDDLPKSLVDVVVRFLNRCTLAVLPRHRRQWGEALVAEQSQISNARERLSWAAGGIAMTAKELLNRMFSERLAWAASVAGGMLSAFVDLQSATRWPHILLLCSFGVILAYWKPKWAWRWTLLLTVGLPAFVLVTKNWGPYSVDRFDVFYGLVPAALGTLAGILLRRMSRSLSHGSVE
jgi:hypothetical protein